MTSTSEPVEFHEEGSSSSLSPYSIIKVHSNGGGFDELNFSALWEWTCVCECTVSVYFMFTLYEYVDLFPTEKGLASNSLQQGFLFFGR